MGYHHQVPLQECTPQSFLKYESFQGVVQAGVSVPITFLHNILKLLNYQVHSIPVGQYASLKNMKF